MSLLHNAINPGMCDILPPIQWLYVTALSLDRLSNAQLIQADLIPAETFAPGSSINERKGTAAASSRVQCSRTKTSKFSG
jgi:hypothetical protein